MYGDDYGIFYLYSDRGSQLIEVKRHDGKWQKNVLYDIGRGYMNVGYNKYYVILITDMSEIFFESFSDKKQIQITDQGCWGWYDLY